MQFLIFSDLDGTFLNHKTYSFGKLKEYINELDLHFEIIFVSSKTYEEIIKIKNKLNINYPFIVENGACIFFPLDYFKNKKINLKLSKYKNHLGLKLTKFDSMKLVNLLKHFKRKYRFSFYNELTDEKIFKITNLNIVDIKLSKLRKFTNPIYWEDSNTKKENFKNELKLLNTKFSIFEGGRFFHVLDNYDKGLALEKFLKIKKLWNNSYTTISLGDSENDIPMLELTDFGCIIKTKTNKNLTLKKKNIFKSDLIAPEGWKESLEYIFNKEIKKNF